MERIEAHPLPARDPVTGGPLVITELQGPDSGISIRGRFEMPRFAQLSPDQARYLETFLRCRGMLNSVEKELGISYPTARARLDAVLKALDLHAVREENAPTGETAAPDVVPETEPDTPPSFYEEPAWDIPAEEPVSFELPVEETEIAEEPEPEVAEPQPRYTRMEVLTLLERGEITPEEAKRELGVAK